MRAFASIFAVALLAACSASSSGAGPAASGDVCADASKAAAERVVAVADANVACSSDADCTTVPLHTSCFDACTRNVSETGKSAVDRAQTLVEAGECKPFRRANCALVTPPCAPPRPPKCNAGKCE